MDPLPDDAAGLAILKDGEAAASEIQAILDKAYADWRADTETVKQALAGRPAPGF